MRSHISRRPFDMRNYLALCAIIVAFAQLSPVYAQDSHHPLHKDFYHHWKVPGTNASCCNARMAGPFGGEIGDCEPAEARVVNGQWQVWIRQAGLWLPVPEDRILRERNPNILDAHVCWTPDRGVICFVPPTVGG